MLHINRVSALSVSREVTPRMKDKETKVFTFNCVWISYLHTFFASSAFIAALIVGCALHYEKIVQNEHYGYPDEWFPSVSATIGDRYPERSVYQILIAMTSGPRFLLAIINFILTNRANSRLPMAMLIVGTLRTLTCGGWTYVTSTDDHDWHDIFMISYIILTLPWTVLNTILSPKGSEVRAKRFYVGSAFFAMIVPLVYFFIQHKVHRVAGSYTTYAFFEWSLIVLDIAFDHLTVYTFGNLEVVFEDEKGVVLKKTVLKIDRKGPSTIGFVIASFNWFVWWSVFTSLGVLIWYFPLWYMGISGYEALLLAIIAPVLLAIAPVNNLLIKFPQISYLGTAVGIAAYWCKKPTDRVCWVAFACGCGAISVATTFNQIRPVAGYQGAAFIVGLMLSAVAKMWLWTNNPLWPVMNDTNGGLNAWGLAFSIAASLLTATSTNSKTAITPTTAPSGSSVISGLGAGALIFALETWVSDTSSLPLWVWEGYPVRGPTPLPHGLITLVAVALGLYIGVSRPKLALSNRLVVAGCTSFVIVQNFKHWTGFFGGLVLVTWLSAVTPALLETAGRYSSWKSFGTAFFVIVLFILGETWTVAYAFVPGGPALRERTWLIMSINTLAVAAGVWNARKQTLRPKALKDATTAATEFAGKVTRLVVGALTVVLALGTLVTVQRLQHVTPAPRHPEVKSMTAGIWTIHFGLDNDMWASETRMMSLIDEMELDVIGLLESDTQRVIGGHRDMTQRMAEELGFYADYGPGGNKHTWGAALLSRFPIVNSTHHLTPSPVGELAPAIHATLDVFGEFVDVFVFHSGQEEDPEDRRLQTKYVTELMHDTPRPAILLSYLVTKPKEGNYNTWVSEFSGMHDIDPSDWDRWCEYILYKDIKRTGYARVSRSTITDTELQVGKFVVGQKPDYSNTRIDEAEVPEKLRFPSIFRGQGVRGHRYHVFDEPRYFQ